MVAIQLQPQPRLTRMCHTRSVHCRRCTRISDNRFNHHSNSSSDSSSSGNNNSNNNNSSSNNNNNNNQLFTVVINAIAPSAHPLQSVKQDRTTLVPHASILLLRSQYLPVSTTTSTTTTG